VGARRKKKKKSSTLDDIAAVEDVLQERLTSFEPRNCAMGFCISDIGHGSVPTGMSISD
jgi:hypothetical protein